MSTKRDYVTKGDWGVSYQSSSHEMGIVLHVYRRSDVSVKCEQCHGRRFFPAKRPLGMGFFEKSDTATDQATRVALAHGHLQPYIPRKRG